MSEGTETRESGERMQHVDPRSMSGGQSGGLSGNRPELGLRLGLLLHIYLQLISLPYTCNTLVRVFVMVASNYLTASQTVDLVSSGKISLEQVVGDHERRYQGRDNDVKAWVVTNHANVRAASKESSDSTGPLRGVMIAVKDMMSECKWENGSSSGG
jgi:hypothetical protein